MSHDILAKRGLEIGEEIIFGRSQTGVSGIDDFSEEPSYSDISESDVKEAIKDHARPQEDLLLLPEVTEPDAVRHYTRLSRKNLAIDLVSYPLGSCTMKYNPKLHEWAARLDGLTDLHPYMPPDILQSALKIYFEMQTYLAEIGGFARVSLAPSAGAQGEFAGLAMIKKALSERGERRKTILVPRSAHGTNPATAAFFSFEVISLDIGDDGRMMVSEIDELMDENCAGLMVTNPNTLGIFESEQQKISSLIHERGGYVYGDGANLNALMGVTRPGDLGVDVLHYNLHKTMTTPHGGGGPGCGAIGAGEELAKYLPLPWVIKTDDKYSLITQDPDSIGRIRSFLGNFAMLVRAWVYIRSLGAKGLRMASEYAVLNANYVRHGLKDHFHLAYESDCLHEVVFSDKLQQENGISALDIAKRLIDYGIHPPTMYFPLVVKGALMVEPTETESLYDLDRMIQAFLAVARECIEDPQLVKDAPQNTALCRLDEAKAARVPVLNHQQSLSSAK